MRAVLLIAALSMAQVQNAAAADVIVATCKMGWGKSYYEADEALLAPKKPEWHDDGWKEPTATLILIRSGDRYNLITRDSIGTRSATEDGGTVFRVPRDGPNRFQIVSIYPGTSAVEVFTFLRFSPKPGGKVIWTTARTGSGGALGPKIGMYVADCD